MPALAKPHISGSRDPLMSRHRLVEWRKPRPLSVRWHSGAECHPKKSWELLERLQVSEQFRGVALRSIRASFLGEDSVARWHLNYAYETGNMGTIYAQVLHKMCTLLVLLCGPKVCMPYCPAKLVKASTVWNI